MISSSCCEQAAPGCWVLWGLNSAVARSVRLLGASYCAYLLERCGSEAAHLCARAQRRRLAVSTGLPVFRLEAASGAARGAWRGICLRWRSANPSCSSTLLWLSRRACFLDLLAARIDVYEENERRSSPHAVLVGRTGCLRHRKRARTQLTKELYWSGCSHPQTSAAT